MTQGLTKTSAVQAQKATRRRETGEGNQRCRRRSPLPRATVACLPSGRSHTRFIRRYAEAAMRLAHIRIGIIANAASFTIKLNLQRKSFTHDMIFVAIHTKRCDARSRNDAPPRFDFCTPLLCAQSNFAGRVLAAPALGELTAWPATVHWSPMLPHSHFSLCRASLAWQERGLAASSMPPHQAPGTIRRTPDRQPEGVPINATCLPKTRPVHRRA